MTAIRSVNFHVWKDCNLKCRFCFATFRDIERNLSCDDAIEVIRRLRAAGCEKLTFAGGEPTLAPHLGRLMRLSREVGLVTSIVTNGERLRPLIEEQAGDIDWIGFSIDSGEKRTQSLLGRGKDGYIARTLDLVELARQRGIRIKLNSVITALNKHEDMSELVRRIRPERWKVFQVLPIRGQNDKLVEPLLVSDADFRTFCERHDHLREEGFPPVPETNDAILGSYAMVDPLGRFFGDSTGTHVYSRPILDVGVEAALEEVSFSAEKLEARGGLYDWGAPKKS